MLYGPERKSKEVESAQQDLAKLEKNLRELWESGEWFVEVVTIDQNYYYHGWSDRPKWNRDGNFIEIFGGAEEPVVIVYASPSVVVNIRRKPELNGVK